jgi:hypothetical protein
MMVPLKVSRSTIAAQSLGSVKVLVQPLKDSSKGRRQLNVYGVRKDVSGWSHQTLIGPNSRRYSFIITIIREFEAG